MRGIEWTASGRPGVLEARIGWRPPRPLLPVFMEKWYPYIFGAERAEAPEDVEIHGPPLISPWNILVKVLRSVLPRPILPRYATPM